MAGYVRQLVADVAAGVMVICGALVRLVRRTGRAMR